MGGAIVHVSPRTLLEDLDFAHKLWSELEGAPMVVTGVGLEPHREAIASHCPGALLDFGATGYGAALMLLGVGEVVVEADLWPDACWETLPLARSRRLPVYHGRGCVHGCDYCPYVVGTGREHIVRSSERTLREFADQVGKHRPKRIVFRDPVFGLDPVSTLELLRGITALSKRERAAFEVETRPELADDEMLDALKEAGCVELKLGVESLEPGPLIATGRVADEVEADRYVEAVEKVLRVADRLGINVRPFVMTGLPGATREGEERTEKMVGAVAAPIVKATVYPGVGLEGTPPDRSDQAEQREPEGRR